MNPENWIHRDFWESTSDNSHVWKFDWNDPWEAMRYNFHPEPKNSH